MPAFRGAASRAALLAFLLSLLLVCAVPLGAAEGPGRLALETPPEARLRVRGELGRRIERNIDHWLLPAPEANPGMLEMLRLRDRSPPPALVPWAGEFAGKYLISAVLALRLSDRADLRARVESFVEELLGCQAEDGYLGPFPRAERLLRHWDLWGHYHVMQGLLLYHEETGHPGALAGAARAADLMCATYLDTGRRVLDAGDPEMNMAVIHVLGMLHRRTRVDRYLRLMREIEKDWESAGDYLRQGLRGVEFHRTPRPRWESLHDVQGLVELHRITGEERYREAFVRLWRSIARLDRHNTGAFSSGEQAVGHPYSPAAIETCCTVAWMALTADMLRLTGDPAAADELELSTWNGLLGAQHPSGRWWTYSTPMDGVREASAHAIVFQARAGAPELNCCSVNGPRGLGILAEWAVLVDSRGPVISFYGPLSASLRLEGGQLLRIEQETDYPAGAVVRIRVRPETDSAFDLRVRIPGWSRRTRVEWPGGLAEDPAPGSYLSLRRTWRPGDEVVLHLDLSLRLWAGDREQAGRISLYRGPLLLAWDQRRSDLDEPDLPVLDAAALAGLDLPSTAPPEGPLAPIVLVDLPPVPPLPSSGRRWRALRLCDYASAGASGTRYRSWLAAERAPPPPPVLERPLDGEALPPGKVLVHFRGARRRGLAEGYEVILSEGPGSGRVLARGSGARGPLELEVPASGPAELFWRVRAVNAHGSTESEARRLRVDTSARVDSPAPAPGELAPQPTAQPTAQAVEGPGGLLLHDPLRGEPRPEHSLLLDAAGQGAAPGPSGETAGAVSLDGERGRLRYAVSEFPSGAYTAAVRFSPRSLPSGRLAQVVSAWALPMDDPLRITVEGGKVFARVEAQGRSFSTEGAPLEAGRWVHAAAVKDGARLTLYLDGVARGSTAVPAEVYSDARTLGLGGNPHFGGNESLPGSFSDLRLYSRALSPEEVKALAR